MNAHESVRRGTTRGVLATRKSTPSAHHEHLPDDVRAAALLDHQGLAHVEVHPARANARIDRASLAGCIVIFQGARQCM